MNHCTHEFVFQESIKKIIANGQFNTYKKTEIFYCKYCLEKKEIKKESTLPIFSRQGGPEWY